MIEWSNYELGNYRINCPMCSRKASDKTLGLTVEANSRSMAHCFRCGFVETFKPKSGSLQQQYLPLPLTQLSKKDWLSDYGYSLWNECQVLEGTVGAEYLKARYCVLPPEGHLRFHPKLKHSPSGYIGPALVALVTDAANGEPMTLHRTWIHPDGRKAAINPPRLLLGGHRKQGGVIRLWGEECITHGLGVAEGIETALSLAHAFEPVWSVIDAGNLAALPVLGGVECLLIAADNDLAGIKAANECASRWNKEGVEVRITQQPQNDLNDALLEAA